MTVNRRRVLELGGTTVAAAVAGCLGAPAAGGTGTSSDTPPPSSPDASSPTPSPSADGSQPTVELTDDLAFVPVPIEVAVGATVTWENVGTVAHSVTAYDDGIPDGAAYFASGRFDSEAAARDGFSDGAIDGGETYEHTFETAGRYEYFCIPHEQAGMTGTVSVG